MLHCWHAEAVGTSEERSTTMLYDSANRKISETDPRGNNATFAYNALGLMTSTTDRLGRRRDLLPTFATMCLDCNQRLPLLPSNRSMRIERNFMVNWISRGLFMHYLRV